MAAGPTTSYMMTIKDPSLFGPYVTINSIQAKLIAYPLQADSGLLQDIYKAEYYFEYTVNYDQLIDICGQKIFMRTQVQTAGNEGSDIVVYQDKNPIEYTFPFGSGQTITLLSTKTTYQHVVGVQNQLAPFAFPADKHIFGVWDGSAIVQNATNGSNSYTMLGQWIHNLTITSTTNTIKIPPRVIGGAQDNPVRMTIIPKYNLSPDGQIFSLFFSFKIRNDTAGVISPTTAQIFYTLNAVLAPNKNLTAAGFPASLSPAEESGPILYFIEDIDGGQAQWTLNEINDIQITYT
jgi:hypothetical protein